MLVGLDKGCWKNEQNEESVRAFMSVNEIKHVIQSHKIIACVRSNTAEHVPMIVDALASGGILCVEITCTTPEPFRLIETVSRSHPELYVGAGTVLDVEDARRAIEAGAVFIVSPVFSPEVVEYCSGEGILSVPGVLSPTEMNQAMKGGAEIVKLFPSSIGGPKVIKELLGPFPHAKIIPSGGVSVDNAKEWLDAGAFAITVGSSLIPTENIIDYNGIRLRAEKFISTIRQA